MKKKIILIQLFFFLVFAVYSQIPSGYYDSAISKTGLALRAALHTIIKNHTNVDYGSLENYYPTTDATTDNKVWDMYSDIPGGAPPYLYTFSQACGNYSQEGDCWNKEHSWPQSWFNGDSPMYSDLFHIVPTDGFVNNKRSNYPYGEVGSATWTSQNGSRLGASNFTGYSGTVFEPIDAYKGDFARNYFYMCTRYYTEDTGWITNDMVDKANLKPWALTMMRQWNLSDTVSQKEIDRNNSVYTIQHNRNPFIDHPEFVDSIWGNINGIEYMPYEKSYFTMYPNPACDFTRICIYNNRTDDFLLIIYNLIGEKIYSKKFSEGKKMDIDLNRFDCGTYFIQIINSTGFNNLQKLIIIK
ncbi:MAG: endonuclease [Bacteroidia bacterium]|nr:endonuclease [Bacteroidia bacterium]